MNNNIKSNIINLTSQWMWSIILTFKSNWIQLNALDWYQRWADDWLTEVNASQRDDDVTNAEHQWQRSTGSAPPTDDRRRRPALDCRRHGQWVVAALRADQQRMMKRLCRGLLLDDVHSRYHRLYLYII